MAWRRITLTLAAALFAVGCTCGGPLGPSCPNPVPTPTPTPTPGPTPTPTPPPNTVPPKGQYVLGEYLLRTNGVRLVRGPGATPFLANGYEQCCLALKAASRVPRRPHKMTVNDVEINSRWPSISIAAMNYAHGQGASNYFMMRVAPYLGDIDHESEWADIGGPVLPGQWPNFNQPWWDENRKFIWYAGNTLGANFEVQWDAWYGKTCKNGSQPCAWPDTEVKAWGETFTAGHQRFIDKIVEEFGCFGNVTWKVDNEGALVPRAKKEYYEAVAAGFRSAEQRFLCGGVAVVHMIGTNWPEQGNGPYDYVTTHADAALQAPIAGKHTANDEHNAPYSPREDHDRFCAAQAQGLHYWYWRAESTDADQDAALTMRKAGCTDQSQQCFAPPDGPEWEWVQTGGSDPTVSSAVRAAESRIGSMCKEPKDHANGDAAVDAAAAEVRKVGICASKMSDAVMAQSSTNPAIWLEYHVSAPYDTGCWSTDPGHYPKATWKYNGTPPTPPAGCTVNVPNVDRIDCKQHVPASLYDCTPKAHGQPILPEGDPQRAACEQKAMGGVPSYSLRTDSGAMSMSLTANPMQVRIEGHGTGLLTCTIPNSSAVLCNYSVDR